jgi:CheY-like chemotaxis protein
VNEAVDLVAALAWPLIVAAVVWFFRQPIGEVLRRTTGFDAFGVSLTFAEQSLDLAASGRKDVTPQGLETAHKRLRREAHLLAGARILWVDNNPRGNFNERKLFERAGAVVDPAIDTEEALDLVERHPYDVVITDWSRGSDASAGPELVEQLHARGITAPVIYYVLVTSNRDKGRAFALTNRPDELVVDVLDAIRRRTP